MSASKRMFQSALHDIEHEWALWPEEVRVIRRYYRGPKTCARFDALPATIRGAIDAIECRKREMKREGR